MNCLLVPSVWFPGFYLRDEACFWAHMHAALSVFDCVCVCMWRKVVECMFMDDAVAPVCTHRYMCVCMRVCNQDRIGTLQEVINSQDYCADTMISKVLHNSLCGKGWLNQSTWKRERDVRFRASCRGPSASLCSCRQSPLWEGRGLNIKEQPCYLGDRNN